MRVGASVSGGAHVALIGWMILFGHYAAERGVPVPFAEVELMSGAEFEAFRACLADTNNAFDKCRAQKEALHAAFSAAR